jgi:hypothetical protein
MIQVKKGDKMNVKARFDLDLHPAYDTENYEVMYTNSLIDASLSKAGMEVWAAWEEV